MHVECRSITLVFLRKYICSIFFNHILCVLIVEKWLPGSLSVKFTDQANAMPVALSELDGWLIASEDGWHIDGRSFRAMFPAILQPAQVFIQEPTSTMQDNVVHFVERNKKLFLVRSYI